MLKSIFGACGLLVAIMTLVSKIKCKQTKQKKEIKFWQKGVISEYRNQGTFSLTYIYAMWKIMDAALA